MSENWKVLDCEDMPSEKDCKLKIKAPEDQVEDLLDAGVAHAVKTHGHEDTPELRESLKGMIKDA